MSISSGTLIKAEDINSATSTAYSATLAASGWVASGSKYTYTYSNIALRCGKEGNIPPIITWTSNQDEYSNITSAEATVEVGIVFTTSTKPTSDIGIIITDIG